MIVMILYCVVMLLWALSQLPWPNPENRPWAPYASGWLNFIAVLLLGIAIYGGRV